MSSPRYYRAPLFRRLLPWLYLGLFCVTAPLLIFYSSGYRYNLKKGQIERNGTLIVDSTPKGAAVFINSQNTDEKTPVTFQNMIPGWVHLHVEKAGYYPWDESLLIRPERVSFAHQIQLWRESQPEFLGSSSITQLQADPLGEKMAAIFSSSTSSPVLRFWSPEAGFSSPLVLSNATQNSQFELAWREDGQALLIQEMNGERHTWWARYRRSQGEINPLPQGRYHWSKSELIGNDGLSVVRLDPLRSRVERTPLPTQAISESTDLELRISTSSEQRILVDESLLTHLYLLPRGAWEFAENQRPVILLRDLDQWLGVELRFGQPVVETLRGDHPRWNPVSKSPMAVFLHEGEVWIWEFEKEPRLIWRQSEPLREIAWHKSGNALFMADGKSLHVIHLTDPTQSSQRLADFDELSDFTFVNNELYISGTREGKTGMWRLRVE